MLLDILEPIKKRLDDIVHELRIRQSLGRQEAFELRHFWEIKDTQTRIYDAINKTLNEIQRLKNSRVISLSPQVEGMVNEIENSFTAKITIETKTLGEQLRMEDVSK